MTPRVENFQEERAMFDKGVCALTHVSIASLQAYFQMHAPTFAAWRGKTYARNVRPGPERLWMLAQLCRQEAASLLVMANELENFAANQPVKGQFGGVLSKTFVDADTLLGEKETPPPAEANEGESVSPAREEPTGEPVA